MNPFQANDVSAVERKAVPSPTATAWRALWCWLVIGIAWCVLAPQAFAQNGSSTARAPTSVSSAAQGEDKPLPQPDDLRKQLDALPTKIDDENDGRKVLTQLAAIGLDADRLAKQRTEELADIDGRLAGLGPTPEAGAPADAPDVAEQRSTMGKKRSAIDSDLKLARLISVDAEQRATDIIKQRRAQFQAAISARVDSPIGASFWRNWNLAAGIDWQRLQSLGSNLKDAFEDAVSSAKGRNQLILYWLGALILIIGGTWIAERVLVRIVPLRLPSGRLRRTLLAALQVVVNVFIVVIGVKLLWNGLRVPASNETLIALQKLTLQLTGYGAYVISLGHALLATRRPSWRLLPISTGMARRLSPFPWWIAAISALGGLATQTGALAGWSLASEVLGQVLYAILIVIVVLAGLRALHAAEPAPEADKSKDDAAASPKEEAAAPQRPLWFALLSAAAGVASVAVLICIAFGYVAFAATLARQTVWTMVVVATMYLLFKLADDLCEALLSSKGAFGERVHAMLGLDAKLLDQASVLTSGLLRVAGFFYMAIALMVPFGTSPDEVFKRGTSVDHSLKFGDFTIAPQALLTAALIVCVGFVGIHLLKRWLTDRYFPNTTLEPGMRSSITTLMGYVFGVVVIAAALAGLGISVERIAWVASALSVGIGFGLQAIVQNFISGLILLAERPVRVGDWVMLGDTEGDVRRVNVRATEIQLFDRSTMIVPNSEFITKSVRNMTTSGAPGRVLMRLPAPLDTDTERMREIILRAYNEHPAVQETPAPIVQLEGIQSGTLTFLAIGYIGNPRNTGGVRSDLLFTILKALRDAGLYLSPPATTSIAQQVAQPGETDAVVDQLTGRT